MKTDPVLACSVLILPFFQDWRLIMSFLCYPLFKQIAPGLKEKLIQNKIYGKDLHKKDNPIIPESFGILPALIYQIYQYLFLPTQAHTTLLAICCIILLGFLDDVLDIPWRVKIIIPLIASIPILQNYEGSTIIKLPLDYGFVDIGILYYVYILLLIGFLSNAINIYAGVNGLETGQTLIIAIFSFIVSFLQESELAMKLLAPFIILNICMYQENKFPAKVFVGDVWCYFSGIVLAVCSVEGRYGKTMLLLIMPQIFNFLYSVPQLFKIIPCPRHRIPKANYQTGLLEDSKNLTLLNLVIRIQGPMSEGDLAAKLNIIQIISCLIGLSIRYVGAYFLY